MAVPHLTALAVKRKVGESNNRSNDLRLLTYLLTPWRIVLLEKLTDCLIDKILWNPKVH